MSELSSSVISSGTDAVALAIKLLGVICFWNGLMAIAQKSGLTELLCKALNPVLKIIFPELTDKKAKEAISMNMASNFLGLGNAATPLGLTAMKRLNEINGNKGFASDDAVRFVVINSAAIHLVPTTVALLRQEYGSASPMEILLPSLINSLTALNAGLILTVILKNFFKEEKYG